MSDTSPEPVTAASEPKPKQPRSAQDKIIAAYIAEAKKFLKVASDDEQIRPILEAHGYDDAEFTTASTLATAAAKAPFATKLTKRGYPAARLATLGQNLDDLTGTGGDQDEALGDAIDDTAQRDAAYDALKTFMKELKGTARGALRSKPGLLAKLEL